jgi:hypothetical protein
MSLNETVIIEENEEVSQVTQENKIENKLDTDTSVDKYKKIINIYSNVNTEEVNISTIDQILEKEKQHNKSEQWTKLDKTVKMQKLHQFAEKYGKENSLSVKDIKQLKTFFTECLGKNKLNKTKDVIYDKERRDINSIPSLHFNIATKNYTLKIMDAKRVSTLKSLTPKKIL